MDGVCLEKAYRINDATFYIVMLFFSVYTVKKYRTVFRIPKEVFFTVYTLLMKKKFCIRYWIY